MTPPSSSSLSSNTATLRVPKGSLKQQRTFNPSHVRRRGAAAAAEICVLLLGALLVLAHRSDAFFVNRPAQQSAFARRVSPADSSASSLPSLSPSTTTTTTQLGLFPKHMIKLAAPATTKGIAAFPPMAIASLALDGNVVELGGGGLFNNLLASVAPAFSSSSPATPSAAVGSPSFQVEILNDISHVALDLFTFLGSPSLVAVRMAAVVGRVLIMAADYLPDHMVLPEEFCFQVFMLGVAWFGLVKSTLPVALSNLASNPVSLRDGKAYVELFAPAGVTWAQFKALSVYASDWVELGEGETITSNEPVSNSVIPRSDDYVYWLYRGQAVVHSGGKQMHEIVRTKPSKNMAPAKESASPAMGLIGELSWATKAKSSAEGASSSSSSPGTSNSNAPGSTVTAGKGGATLMRIHKSNLSKLMKDDVELGHSIKDLMFQGIQDKLMAAQQQQLALRA